MHGVLLKSVSNVFQSLRNIVLNKSLAWMNTDQCILGQVSPIFLKIDLSLFKSKKDGKEQESIQSSTTPDPG